MRSENIPSTPSPERPPLAPYDPPDPAPQASAWRRALRVIGHAPAPEYGSNDTVLKTTFRNGC
jgi:hypothetical protein